MEDLPYKRLAAILAPVLLLGASPVVGQVGSPLGELPPVTETDRALLKGAIDIHTHLDPDSFGPHSVQAKRELDVVENAKRAKESGMRGFVIKQHYDQTAQLAYI